MTISNKKLMLSELEKVQAKTRTCNFESLEEIENLLTKANDFVKQITQKTDIKLNPDALIEITISAYTGRRFASKYKGIPETTWLYFKKPLNSSKYTFYCCQRNKCNQSSNYEGYSISIR